jgi:hypothetical protein
MTPAGELITVWFTPRWRLQTGPSQLSVPYRYTTDIRRFKEFLDTVSDRRAIAHQDLPVTRQFSQFTDVPGWNDAGLEQTVAQQITNPISITHVRLLSGYSLDVVGVHEQDGTVVFEQIEDRPPVDSSTLNGDVSATRRQEPVSQLP